MSSIDEFIVITATNVRCASYFLERAHGVLNDAVALYFEQGEISIPENYRTELIQSANKAVQDIEKDSKLMNVQQITPQKLEIPPIPDDPSFEVPAPAFVHNQKPKILPDPYPGTFDKNNISFLDKGESIGYFSKPKPQVNNNLSPEQMEYEKLLNRGHIIFYRNGYVINGEFKEMDRYLYMNLIENTLQKRYDPLFDSYGLITAEYRLNEIYYP